MSLSRLSRCSQCFFSRDTPSALCCSACGFEAQRIEEMEKMLKEAQQEKARLMENRVSFQRGRTSREFV